MAVAIEDNDGHTQIYDTAAKVEVEGDKYVVYGPFKSVLAVVPRDDVKRLASDEESPI